MLAGWGLALRGTTWVALDDGDMEVQQVSGVGGVEAAVAKTVVRHSGTAP
jgi:hypothetical protein